MDIKSQIRAFANKNFYVPEGTQIADDRSLLDQGVIDSTGVFELIGFIEETFGITVQDDETLPENLDSLDRISAFVARKLSTPVD
jgi:acyl carrier protein